MLFKKFLLITLMATSACNIRAANPHEIRTWGVVSAGVLVTWAGVHVLVRQNYDISHKMLDVALGLVLVAAGLYGIVMSDKITHYVERRGFN